VSNIPWQERGCQSADVVWRYSENPVVKRDAIPTSNSIFKASAVSAIPRWICRVFPRVTTKAVLQMNIFAGL